jgi:hypothetical protein
MLFALPLLVSAAAAFVLPAGISDGFYMAHINEDGLEVHTRLPSSPSSADVAAGSNAVVSARDPSALASQVDTSPNPKLSKRISSIWCGCGVTLDRGNCDAAVAGFKSQVAGGRGIPPYTAWYEARGNVIFFSCNAGDAVLYHDVNIISNIAAEITRACGLYIAGTFQREEYSGEASGYMRNFAGLNFCADAKSSPLHRC